MSLQLLLQRVLFLFGIGFLIANLLVIADLIRFRLRKRSALLVWQGEKPRFYGFSLALGVMLLSARSLAGRTALAEEPAFAAAVVPEPCARDAIPPPGRRWTDRQAAKPAIPLRSRLRARSHCLPA